MVETTGGREDYYYDPKSQIWICNFCGCVQSSIAPPSYCPKCGRKWNCEG